MAENFVVPEFSYNPNYNYEDPIFDPVNFQATDHNNADEFRMSLLNLELKEYAGIASAPVVSAPVVSAPVASAPVASAPVAPKTRKTCPKCNKTFSLSSGLSKHKKICGVTELDFACDYAGCEYKATAKINLVKHKQSHGEKKFVCDICDARFKIPATLRDHRRIHFAPTFFCDKCGIGFKTSSNLCSHKKHVHPV